MTAEEIVMGGYASFAAGDMEALGKIFHPDCKITMHAQHALQPEQQKGLGFLGSIYTNEGAWKTMAKFSKSTKRDE